MNLAGLLEEKGVRYQTMKHTPAFTAQELAAVEHVPGDNVAKVVVVWAGGKFRLLVLPASYNVRFDRLDRMFGAGDCRLATEEEIKGIFADCELGAMPPFGREYGIETYADAHLAEDEEIIFQAGHHDEALKLKWQDYVQIEQPKLIDFAEHLR